MMFDNTGISDSFIFASQLYIKKILRHIHCNCNDRLYQSFVINGHFIFLTYFFLPVILFKDGLNNTNMLLNSYHLS